MSLYDLVFERISHHAPKDRAIGKREMMFPGGVGANRQEVRSRERIRPMETGLKRKPGAEPKKTREPTRKPQEPPRAPIEWRFDREPLLRG